MIVKELSASNKKLITSLNIKKYRLSHKLFVVEGEKMCKELIDSKFSPTMLVIEKSKINYYENLLEKYSLKNSSIFYTSEQIFEKISDAVTPQGILAVVKYPENNFDLNDNFIALDNIADPGNLGTIIRTSEWFGFKNIILGNNCADLFNPKTLRATMGSIFRLNFIEVNNLENYIIENFGDFDKYGATLDGDYDLNEIIPDKKFGLFFGNESSGLSDSVKNTLTKRFIIKGKGQSESLNVSVATGISMFYFSKFV